MTRSHAFPRRASRRGPGPFPALDLRLPTTRVLGSVNVARADKSIVDSLQSYFSYREGRAVTQEETMHLLLQLVLAHPDHPLLAGFEVPRHIEAARIKHVRPDRDP